MLAELHIRNFALIDELELALGPGLNVLTGETGAGKSIIIDAVALLLGGRGSQEYIRSGSDKCLVEGRFVLQTEQRVSQRLADLGYEPEGGQLFLSRELSTNGRNLCRVQGRTVPLGLYKEISSLLIDIHGQSDYQSLLRPENHVDLLDCLSDENLSLRQRVRHRAENVAETKRKLHKLTGEERDLARREDMLKFQVEEISSASLKPGEDEELARERLLLANTEKLLNLAGGAYANLYTGHERQKSALDLVSAAMAQLRDLSNIDTSLADLAQSLENIYYQLEDAAREIRGYKENLGLDPLRQEQVEERLILIKSLKRKYGDSVEEIQAYYRQACAELEDLTKQEEIVARLTTELAAEEKEYWQESAELSQARKNKAAILEAAIARQLADLYMPKTQFSVHFEQKQRVDPAGQDEVEFMFSPNPGEPLKPLAKTASGGELSRVILALKTILAAVDPVPTLIFDEVDSGVGGEAVLTVAKKLAAIGQTRQVICVTHSPHVASFAGLHFLISKEFDAGRTLTRVKTLEPEARAKELARMLGGVSKLTLDHAAELLKNA